MAWLEVVLNSMLQQTNVGSVAYGGGLPNQQRLSKFEHSDLRHTLACDNDKCGLAAGKSRRKSVVPFSPKVFSVISNDNGSSGNNTVFRRLACQRPLSAAA